MAAFVFKDELGRKSTKSRAAVDSESLHSLQCERLCAATRLVLHLRVLRAPSAGGGGEPARWPLHECRLEHPLQVSSVAARCGELAGRRGPRQPPGAHDRPACGGGAGAQSPPRGAPLFLLAGGPGQARRDMYVRYAGAFARINRKHDIVLVDQRGTGRVGSRCSAITRRTGGRHATSCRRCAGKRPAPASQSYGERVRFYTTSVAVARSRRGARGARLCAQSICTAPPTARAWRSCTCAAIRRCVHAVVLDGVTYPEQAIGPETPLDGERALDLIVARCRDCAGLRRRLSRLARRARGAARRVRTRETRRLDHRRSRSGRAARARVQSQRA